MKEIDKLEGFNVAIFKTFYLKNQFLKHEELYKELNKLQLETSLSLFNDNWFWHIFSFIHHQTKTQRNNQKPIIIEDRNNPSSQTEIQIPQLLFIKKATQEREEDDSNIEKSVNVGDENLWKRSVKRQKSRCTFQIETTIGEKKG